MAVYHISRKGEPALCRAKAGNCPLGDLEGQAHGSKAEVARAIEAFYAPAAVPVPQRDDGHRSKIVALRDELFKCSQAYYQGGVSPLTDDEYDDRKAYLQHLLNSSTDVDLHQDEVIRAILEEKVAAGTSVGEDQAVFQRQIPMLSQRKADTHEDLKDYLKEALRAGATGFKLQAKLDGISFAAVYVNGRLVHCTGRGDGTKGQDYTQPILSGEVKVEGLPLQLEGAMAKLKMELRGELFIRRGEFERASNEGVAGATPQIMVSSGLNRGSSKATYTFTVFSQVSLDGESKFSTYDADQLRQNGFIEITDLTKEEWARANPDLTDDFSSLTDVDTLMAHVEDFGTRRSSLDIPTDGIVVKPINEVEMLSRMGATAHHPKSQIAFKYTGAMGVTRMKSLRWSVRGTGEVAAVIAFENVELGGKNFGGTSLPHATMLNDMDLGPGSDVLIERYRDQAAKFRSLQSKSPAPYRTPSACPSCGGELVTQHNRPDPGNRVPYAYTNLLCTNQTCKDRVRNSYGRRGLDFDGLGPAKVEALLNSGRIETVADLVKLTSADSFKDENGVYPKGITARSATTLAESVKRGRERLQGNFELGLMSLNLYGLTQDRAAELAKAYKSVDEILNADVRKLSESFSENLHETEQNHMLEDPVACAERLQSQLRNSIDLRKYRDEGIIF